MAGVYTTKRGKNKKAKLGQRKDAANNAATKLSTKVEKSLLETVMEQREETRVLTVGSSEQRRKTAVLRAQEKLQLTAATEASAASSSSLSSSLSSLSLSPPAPASLSACQYSLCPQKQPPDMAKDEDGKAEAAVAAPLRLLQCGGCRLVSYCCSDCQRADWPQHRLACRHAQQLIKAAMHSASADQTPATSTALQQPTRAPAAPQSSSDTALSC